jgi:hypothetical protein
MGIFGGRNVVMEEIVDINFGRIEELMYELWVTLSEYTEKMPMSRLEIDLAIIALLKALYEYDRRRRGKKL